MQYPEDRSSNRKKKNMLKGHNTLVMMGSEKLHEKNTVYTRVSTDFWGFNFEANFKDVASYTRYRISVYTGGSGYAIV